MQSTKSDMVQVVLTVEEYEGLLLMLEKDFMTRGQAEILRNARIESETDLKTVKVIHSDAKYLNTDEIDLVLGWSTDEHNNLHLIDAAGNTTCSYRNWNSVTSVPEVEEELEGGKEIVREDEQSD